MIQGPYPGLRPFTEEQTGIFFGRDRQVDQLLDILGHAHFVAVVGVSGCGKSSLVRAGLLPALKAGFLADAGIEWRTATMYPGEHPMQNLARTILEGTSSDREKSESSHDEDLAFLLATLRRGRLGLVEALQEIPLPEHTNLLIVVDQFEELFRQSVKHDVNEAIAFVALLLAAAEQRSNIFVVITMRSDFLGDCPFFHGLPEAINASQFLTPRLTREQCQAAIQGPAAVFGNRVEADVVTHLLNEMGNNPDQLPVLQHCLMRMWQHALRRHGKDETATSFPQGIELTWADYEAVGALQHAMSQHGEEALQEARDRFGKARAEQIAEYFFRALVEVTTNRRDMRRPPVSLVQIAKETSIPPTQLQDLVEIFASPRFGFIQVYKKDDIPSETTLWITHESLIRLWKHLKTWVDTEDDAAKMYQRLEQTAKLKQKNRAGWLTSPELETLWKWKTENRPNAAWAQRYGENFDLAIRFLDTSKQVEDEKRLAQKHQQQAALRRTRRQRTVAVIGLVIALSFAIWALWERSKAEKAIREKIQAFEDIRKAKNTIEAEKYRTEKALEKAEEAKKNTELNIARFKEMVNTTFGFLLESSQHERFLRWADRTAVIERLIPVLHLMIDLFEELDMEEKQYWHDTLFFMKDSAKLVLLGIMGTEAVQRAKEKKEFQIHILQITKEITKEKINPSLNGAYFIEPDEKIAIIPYINDPPNHRYKYRYKAIRGEMVENYYSISKDALEGYDLIAIQAVSDDDKNEILAQKIIKIKINDLEKLLNDLEKTLKLKLEL